MCWGSKSAPLLSSNFGHDHFTACRWVCKRAACFELLSFAVFQELSIVFGKRQCHPLGPCQGSDETQTYPRAKALCKKASWARLVFLHPSWLRMDYARHSMPPGMPLEDTSQYLHPALAEAFFPCNPCNPCTSTHSRFRCAQVSNEPVLPPSGTHFPVRPELLLSWHSSVDQAIDFCYTTLCTAGLLLPKPDKRGDGECEGLQL
eukprot:1159129-Pelagomonas_calceolata.AAC.5